MASAIVQDARERHAALERREQLRWRGIYLCAQLLALQPVMRNMLQQDFVRLSPCSIKVWRFRFHLFKRLSNWSAPLSSFRFPP